MRQFRFVSNRTLKNKAGQETGRMKVLVKVDSENAETDYICPECLFAEHVSPEWSRPFSVKCSKCGFKMELPKLKEAMKKEKDKEKKAKQKELMEKMAAGKIETS